MLMYWSIDLHHWRAPKFFKKLHKFRHISAVIHTGRPIRCSNFICCHSWNDLARKKKKISKIRKFRTLHAVKRWLFGVRKQQVSDSPTETNQWIYQVNAYLSGSIEEKTNYRIFDHFQSNMNRNCNYLYISNRIRTIKVNEKSFHKFYW